MREEEEEDSNSCPVVSGLIHNCFLIHLHFAILSIGLFENKGGSDVVCWSVRVQAPAVRTLTETLS